MSAEPGRICVRDHEVHDPGLADLERSHGPADGPPRVDRTGYGPGPCRHRQRAVRSARPGPQRRRALDRAAHRRGDPRRCAARSLGGPHPGKDVRPAWHRAPAVHGRPAHVDGGLSALPSSVPMHPEPVRFTPEQADEVIAAIGDALADTELTLDELTEAIVDRTGPWAGERTMEAFQGMWPRWRQLTSTAAHRGVLCFGANRGRNVTYTNQHRWLPGFRPDDGDAALRGLVTRYLYAYGPATPQHFGKWLNIPARRAVALFEAPAGEVGCVELDG